MKRKYILTILWILWIISIVIIIIGVFYYIDKKKIKLRNELRDNVEALFQGQATGDGIIGNDCGFFYAAFSNSPVLHYKKTSIPSRPLKRDFSSVDPKEYEKIQDYWKQSYGDISSIYELNWGDEYNENDVGWNIIRIYCGGLNEEFIRINIFFPYAVGFRRTEGGNYYTVEQAVNEAYNFYATDSKSRFANGFRQGNVNSLWNKIYDCFNEFYRIRETNNPGYTMGFGLFNLKWKGPQRTKPYEEGCMQNGFYRVYIAATQERFYGIQEQDRAISANRNTLLLWWCIGISVIFLLFIIPLTIQQVKSNKKKSETLYQRLVRLCNPKEFIDNYDKEKVEKANLIYKRLLEANAEDKDTLMNIQILASTELGINFIDKTELDELKEKVNPKRFLNPYNADKVSLANELYAILAKDNITYKELIEVKEKSKDL